MQEIGIRKGLELCPLEHRQVGAKTLSICTVFLGCPVGKHYQRCAQQVWNIFRGLTTHKVTSPSWQMHKNKQTGPCNWDWLTYSAWISVQHKTVVVGARQGPRDISDHWCAGSCQREKHAFAWKSMLKICNVVIFANHRFFVRPKLVCRKHSHWPDCVVLQHFSCLRGGLQFWRVSCRNRKKFPSRNC